MPEHQGHVHVAGPEHAQRLRWLGLGQHEIHAGRFGLEPGGGGGHDRAERRREGGQPDPALAQPDMGREFILRRVQPPDDLLGSLGQ